MSQTFRKTLLVAITDESESEAVDSLILALSETGIEIVELDGKPFDQEAWDAALLARDSHDFDFEDDEKDGESDHPTGS